MISSDNHNSISDNRGTTARVTMVTWLQEAMLLHTTATPHAYPITGRSASPQQCHIAGLPHYRKQCFPTPLPHREPSPITGSSTSTHQCHTTGPPHYRKQCFSTPLPHRGPTPLWEAVLLHTTATPPASTSTGSSASPHHCRDAIAPRVRNHTFTDGVFILCATVATRTLGREFMVSTKTDFRQERGKNLFLQR